MAAIPAPAPAHAPPRSRLRRWLIGAFILLCLLGAYAFALRWVTLQIGQDVQDTLRAVPVLDDHTPRIN